ncbi:methyl-accepting chemotaxis protein [Clostridium sp. AM58-1XD]|uniref:methyl-accepting chemotaxis protein n=1 Tax=Clostridium sp. AM58-1XD TaxID=2292307 RepID=UPI001FA9400B|nr:methyl-accepting chemotaxis protein [Clostridium sp. AM58-1XD]
MAILTKDDILEEEKIESAKRNLAAMRETFPIIRSTFNGDIGLVDQIEAILNEAIVYRDQVFQLIIDDKDEEAFAIMDKEYIPRLDQMGNLLIEISDTAGNNAERMVKQGEHAVLISELIVFIILIISVLLALILGIYISDSIRKPVAELEKAAKMISDGDMNPVITYRSRDELGNLSASMRTTVERLSSIIEDLTFILKEIASGNFNPHTKAEQDYVGDFRPLLSILRQMNTDLSETMELINQSADQVSEDSDQVSSGAQALSQGAAEQACSIEELAANVNEISKRVKQNAENAQDANTMAAETGEQLIRSNQRMQEMIRAMKEINVSSGEVAKIIKQ